MKPNEETKTPIDGEYLVDLQGLKESPSIFEKQSIITAKIIELKSVLRIKRHEYNLLAQQELNLQLADSIPKQSVLPINLLLFKSAVEETIQKESAAKISPLNNRKKRLAQQIGELDCEIITLQIELEKVEQKIKLISPISASDTIPLLKISR